MQTWWWTKLILEVIKKAKRWYLLCIKGTIYGKLRCNFQLRLQTHEKKKKHKSMLTKVFKKKKAHPNMEPKVMTKKLSM